MSAACIKIRSLALTGRPECSRLLPSARAVRPARRLADQLRVKPRGSSTRHTAPTGRTRGGTPGMRRVVEQVFHVHSAPVPGGLVLQTDTGSAMARHRRNLPILLTAPAAGDHAALPPALHAARPDPCWPLSGGICPIGLRRCMSSARGSARCGGCACDVRAGTVRRDHPEVGRTNHPPAVHRTSAPCSMSSPASRGRRGGTRMGDYTPATSGGFGSAGK